jgi:hypothetical protein
MQQVKLVFRVFVPQKPNPAIPLTYPIPKHITCHFFCDAVFLFQFFRPLQIKVKNRKGLKMKMGEDKRKDIIKKYNVS